MMPKARKAIKIQTPVDWKKDPLSSLLWRHSRRPHRLRQQVNLGCCVSVLCAGGMENDTTDRYLVVMLEKKTDSSGRGRVSVNFDWKRKEK